MGKKIAGKGSKKSAASSKGAKKKSLSLKSGVKVQSAA
jgi:hypothetical protein